MVKNMNEMPEQSYPAPQKSNNGCLWAALIFVTLVLCIFCSIGGLIGFYYSAEIISGVRELVDIIIVDPVKVVAEGDTSSSPADEDDETDTPANPYLPNGDELVIPKGTMLLICGRELPNGETIETLAMISLDYIEDGAPLQQYYHQVVTARNAEKFETETGVKIADEVEIFNDACQWIAYEGLDGVIYILEIPRDAQESVLIFNEVSHITASWSSTQDIATFKVCRHDTGNPGTWVGDGKDCITMGKFGVDTFVFDDYWSADFDPYYTALMQNPLSLYDYPFNNKAEIWFEFVKRH